MQYEIVNGVLNLSYSNLTEIPDAVWELKGVIELDLTDNPLKKISPKIANFADTLTMLDVSECNLEVLPPEIGKLHNLETLYLVDNQLSDLPDELWQLKKLALLDISSNLLRTIPKGIVNLANSLTELHAWEIKMTNLPPEIGKLVNLQVLGLVGNKLIELPDEIGNLSNLLDLDLSINDIVTLPASFINLRNSLEELSLEDNPIVEDMMASSDRLSDFFDKLAIYLDTKQTK